MSNKLTTLTRITEAFGLYPYDVYPVIKGKKTNAFLKELGIEFVETPKRDTFKYEFELTLTNCQLLLSGATSNKKNKTKDEGLKKFKDYLKQIIEEKSKVIRPLSELTSKEFINSEIDRLYKQDELIKSTGLELSEIIKLATKKEENETVCYSVSGNRVDIKGEIESMTFYGGTTTIKLKKGE